MNYANNKGDILKDRIILNYKLLRADKHET